MLTQMTVDEIMHWIGELTSELARRASQPATPTAPQAPWVQPPPAWRAPQVEPKARPFTAQRSVAVNLPPVPEGGLPPGTPLTRAPAEQQPAADPVAALVEQLRAQIAGQPVATPAPQRGIVTTTAKTDPEAARVFLGVPPRPDGAPPINGAGIAAGGAIVEPA